jgi:hypothetical protein
MMGRKLALTLDINVSQPQGSFVALLIASAILISSATQAKAQLRTGKNPLYINDVSTSRGYQGLTWGTTGTSLLISLLLFAELNMERFTPYGQRISRHWKPSGVSWLGRREPELRRQQREQRMTIPAVEGNGRGGVGMFRGAVDRPMQGMGSGSEAWGDPVMELPRYA